MAEEDVRNEQQAMTKPREFQKTDTGARFLPPFSDTGSSSPDTKPSFSGAEPSVSCTKPSFSSTKREAIISLTLLLLATITVWTLIIVYL